ncbi:MAG: LysM peptidoglycan-binding domain-containing protein [Bacteroidota bacterium]
MKRLMVCLLAATLFAGLRASVIVPGDSIGKKILDGKRYVKYKIAQGDNLSQVAREYRTSVKELMALNAMSDPGLSIGQVILVPGTGNTEVASTAPATAPANTHTVEPGETLYGISRKYKVTVAQIQEWNALSESALSPGQTLKIAAPTAADAPATEPVEPTREEVVVVKEKPRPIVKQRPGRHVVLQGETLYGIARTYGMDAREIKKINNLRSNEIQEGQELIVRAEMPPNANGGTSLIQAIEEVTAGQEKTPQDEFPELEVLTVKEKTRLAPNAKVTAFTDKFTKQEYQRVEEVGKAGPIEDFNTDQTKFYAFHKYVPAGSYLRIDHPAKGQSILVEVINSLPGKDPYAVRLSAKCRDYLMITGVETEVVMRYVIPMAK